MLASIEYTRSAYVNLSGYLSFEQDVPQGAAYRFTAPGLGIANTMNFGSKLRVTPSIDFTYFNYSSASRVDQYYSLRTTVQYVVTSHWNLLADAGYIFNRSNLSDVFQYNRALALLGATYFF